MAERRRAVAVLASVLVVVLGCAGWQARRSAPVELLAAHHHLSFAQWYQQQSAAAWFGGDMLLYLYGTMHKKVQVGHQEFAASGNKAKWLTKQDLQGIPAVLKAAQAKKLKHEAVELAMARLAAKQKASGLAKALTQQLAGYGDMAELNKLAPKVQAEVRSTATAKIAQTAASPATQKLFELPERLKRGTQQLWEVAPLKLSAEDEPSAGSGEIYRPTPTEGDGPDLPEGRILNIVSALDTKFLNRSTSTFAANEKHHQAKTAEEVAKEKAEEAARKAEEEAAEKVMSSAAPKLRDMLSKQIETGKEQDVKLAHLSTTLNDILDPQGYTSADITQCGDHCVEVQVAAAHQAEVARRREEEAREEEDRELNTPIPIPQ